MVTSLAEAASPRCQLRRDRRYDRDDRDRDDRDGRRSMAAMVVVGSWNTRTPLWTQGCVR